jgi:hypothetical protein
MSSFWSRRAEGGTRKVLLSNVFLCIYYVTFSALLFVSVFPAIMLSFGVTTFPIFFTWWHSLLHLLNVALLH